MSRQVEGLRRFVGAPAEPQRTFTNVIVTAGGKGGVGTSSVTMLVGLGLARAGRRVLVIDGGEGSLHLMLGLDAGGGLVDSARNVDGHEAFRWIDSGLAVLAAGPTVEPSVSTMRPMERRQALARTLSLHTTFDLVLIDAGSSVDAAVQACGFGVDRLIAVTDASRLATSGAFALLRAASARYSKLPLQVVVNREAAESVARVESTICDALQPFHNGPVGVLGVVPFDAELETNSRQDGLIQHLAPSSPAARAALRLGLMLTLGSRHSAPQRPRVRELEPTGT